jgi:hypothetical protein
MAPPASAGVSRARAARPVSGRIKALSRQSQIGQEESLAKRNLPVSERLLMIEAAIHGSMLDDGRSATAASRSLQIRMIRTAGASVRSRETPGSGPRGVTHSLGGE